MRIIVLLSLDAANMVLENVVKELNLRGHMVSMYALSTDYHNIRMFKTVPAEIHEINELTNEIIDQADIILAANEMVGHAINARKYIFTVNMASVLGTNLSEAGDVMFMPSYQYYWDGGEDTTKIVVGNPKKQAMLTCATEQHSILFIDSGHFPFGMKGKKQVASMILRICHAFSDYKITIKPRFLKKDKDVTHNNKIHIYDVLTELSGGRIPTNLVMLNEHVDMMELISKSELVITLYGSSVFDVASTGKKCLIAYGFSNEDSIDLNNTCTWETEFDILSESGCLVRFDEILDYIPNGLFFEQGFCDKHIPCFDNKMAYEHIVDIVEYVYNEYIHKHRFIKKLELDAKDYKNRLCADDEENWNRIIKRRYWNQLRYYLSRSFDRTGIRIQKNEYIEWCTKTVNSIHCEGGISLDDLRFEAHKRFQKILLNHSNEVRGNEVGESYWLEAINDIQPSTIFSISRDELQCKRSYDYFSGIQHLNRREYPEAIHSLKKYLDETETITHEKCITDLKSYQMDAMEKINGLFPFDKVERDSHIILYGYGCWGKIYYQQIKESGYCSVVAVADTYSSNIISGELDIISPNEINNHKYDCIFITVRDDTARNEIKELLIKNKCKPII